MRRTSSLAVLAAVLVVLGPAPALASTMTECQAALRSLSQRTEDMLFLRGDQGSKAQARLVAQLKTAQAQLDRLDLQAALRNLDAYSTELSRASGSGALRADNAVFLQESANGVIVCITRIGK